MKTGAGGAFGKCYKLTAVKIAYCWFNKHRNQLFQLLYFCRGGLAGGFAARFVQFKQIV